MSSHGKQLVRVGPPQPVVVVAQPPLSTGSVGSAIVQSASIPPPPYAEEQSFAQPGTETTAVHSQQAIYRRQPVTVICHACGAVVQTSTKPKMGLAIAGSLFALFFVGCQLGCCLFPLCVRDMYDTVHSCPSCKTQVGVHKVVKL